MACRNIEIISPDIIHIEYSRGRTIKYDAHGRVFITNIKKTTIKNNRRYLSKPKPLWDEELQRYCTI